MATDGEIMSVLADALRERGELVLPASGVSMGAGFSGVEGLVIRSASITPPRFGSLVVFSRGGRWLAHRVIWSFGPQSRHLCITKGDANAAWDWPFVGRGEAVGVVVGLRRDGAVQPVAAAWRRAVASLLVALASSSARAVRKAVARGRGPAAGGPA